MSPNTPKIQSTHPMGPDGIVRCHHGEQVEKFVSQTPANPGREFYVCSRPIPDRCKFWFWTDDPIFKRRPPQTPRAAPSNGPCTPQPTPLSAKRKRPEGSATSPRASQAPSSSPASADTPSKKARLAAIEAGLRARSQDESPSQPKPVPEHPDALPFTHGVEPYQAPSPASEAATDVGPDVEPPARYSFLGLPPTQESDSGAGPSTPKKRPSSSVDGRQDLYDHHGEASSSALLTPPQSLKTNRIEAFAPTASGSGSGSSRPEPVTPTRPKGKQRANPGWSQSTEAEENPFIDSTGSFKSKLESSALSRPRSPRSSLDSQGPSYSPTTGERITTHLRGMRDTINTLRMYAEHLDQLDADKYIERLERQKNALGVGDEAKKDHITALVAERDELKEKLRRCEERCRAKDQIIAGFKALC